VSYWKHQVRHWQNIAIMAAFVGFMLGCAAMVLLIGWVS
jgi:hypothetical protein